MTRRSRRHAIDAKTLTKLRDFARGYLHQDVLVEHGSAERAAEAFTVDASRDERRELADGLTRLAEAARSWPAERLSRFFTDDLGAAWTPGSIDDVRALEAIARRDEPGK